MSDAPDGNEFEQVGKAFDRDLLRRLWTFARPDSRAFVVAIVLLFAVTGLEVLLPWLLRLAVDGPVAAAREAGTEILNAGDAERSALYRHVGLLALAALAIAVVTFAARYGQFVVIQSAGQRVLHRVRSALFRQLERLPIAYYDRTPTGRLVSRVTNDIETLNELFTSGIINLLGDVTKVIALLVAAFFIHPGLALIGTAAVPALALASAYFRIRARQGYRETRTAIAKVTGYLAETIAGIRVLQAFSREDLARNRFATRCREYLDANLRTIFYFALFFPVADGLTLVAQGGVFWKGGWLILGGAFTVGQFLQVWFYLSLMFEPLREMAEKYNILQSAMASAERVFHVLDEAAEPADRPTAIEAPRFDGAIEFDHVDFEYRKDTPILKDVSFAVRPGETIALVGATGGGKTTITSLLARFYDVTRGSIAIDGHDLRDYTMASLRQNLAYVPQDTFLFTGTVLDNLTLGHPELDPKRAIAAAEAIGADRLIARWSGGYDHVLSERGANLSAGERQMLAFARALAVDPAILILDEATANIDPESEQMIEKALVRLLEGRTSIVVAHRLSTIRRASRILVVQRGQIREQGTHDELMASNGIYRRLHDLQFKVPRPAAAAAPSNATH